MKLSFYFTFPGTCREAISFYKEIFNCPEPQVMTYGEVPPSPDFQIPPELGAMIMHAELNIAGETVFLSDAFPEMGYTFGKSDYVTVALGKTSADEAKALFDKLSVGGEVVMPLAPTFWSPAYGMVQDKFGIKWQISAEA